MRRATTKSHVEIEPAQGEKRKTQRFTMHASGYSPVDSSSSLTSWPTWLNPTPKEGNGTSKLDLCIIRAIVARALCTVVCIGERSSCPIDFQRYGRLLPGADGPHTRHRNGRQLAGHGREGHCKAMQAMRWRPFTASPHPFSFESNWKEKSEGCCRGLGGLVWQFASLRATKFQ